MLSVGLEALISPTALGAFGLYIPYRVSLIMMENTFGAYILSLHAINSS